MDPKNAAALAEMKLRLLAQFWYKEITGDRAKADELWSQMVAEYGWDSACQATALLTR